MSKFAIHSLPLLTGQVAIAPLPGRGGSYAADLQTLITWAPTLVISMTTKAEMKKAGAACLGRDLMCAGINWRHVPTQDFGVPERLDWPGLRTDVHAVLQRGQKVLVHCFGGCGRSGMMILRLMVSVGEDPDTALIRLRQVRSCAVETDGQMVWARNR